MQEDRDGSAKYALLSDLELDTILCQPSSPLWMSSFLLQPFTPLTRQHPLYHGTFVAKYNALATTSCIRVLQIGSYFYEMDKASAARKNTTVLPDSTARDQSEEAQAEVVRPRASSGSTGTARRADRVALQCPPSARASGVNHNVEEIIQGELRKVVHEVELAFHDKLRLLTGEFQVTSSHRLVLLRVSHIVFFSDLKKRDNATPANGRHSQQTQRPSVLCVF